MEKKSEIPQKEFEQGYFIELQCAFCRNETTVAASSKKELHDKVKDSGWKNIDSDKYQLIGHWCGCDYKD